MSNYFNEAQNFTVNGLTQNDVHIDLEQSKEKAFEILQREMVPGSSHNSKERYDAPKCHPETRRAVLRNIKSWINSTDDSTCILWLNGPAGAGKSAIAQTTAIESHIEGKLVASFFFSRYSNSRSRKDGLVATIAYQICISIPAAKDYIIESIAKNPNIFDLDIQTQVELLVVEPLGRVDQECSMGTREQSTGPRLIVVDGLDECVIRKDQAEIIEAFASSLTSNTGHGLRVLFASRPELEIRRAFKINKISLLCTHLVLDDTFNPDKDIDLYLRSHFQTLKRQHEMGTTLPVTWPSNEAIRQIVKKSSGQFIYASTVVKYISDPRRNPKTRLDMILKILPENDDKPFAPLDALYSAILSTCEDYQKVVLIFEAIMFLYKDDESGPKILKSIEYLESFLALEGEVLLVLIDLHSIIDVNNIRKRGFRFYHASMYDFLTDVSRSRQFYIDKNNAHASISIHCLNTLINYREVSGRPLDTAFVYSITMWSRHYMDSGWNIRVSKYTVEMNILRADNRQMAQVCRIHESLISLGDFNKRTSMLGKLLMDVEHYNMFTYIDRDFKAGLPDVVVVEFLNQLKLFPRQDILATLYQLCITCKDFKLAFQLVDADKNLFDWDVNSILGNDMSKETSLSCFKFLMKSTAYIDELPEDTRAMAISYILDLSWDKRMHVGIDALENIFENIPLSCGMVNGVLKKWGIVKMKHDELGYFDVDHIDQIDEYIWRNCERELRTTRW